MVIFEKDYIDLLIRFGEEDTEERMTEIREFLTRSDGLRIPQELDIGSDVN